MAELILDIPSSPCPALSRNRTGQSSTPPTMPAARPASHAVAGQQVPPHIAQFVDDFYRVTDEEDPKAYANMYTKDGSLFVVASRKGREEIEAGCRASYTQRDNSVHRYHHIMVTQPDRELFVTGDIDFDRRVDGEKIRNVPWVARITLREEEGSLKIEDYYVWVHFPPVKVQA